MTYAFRVLAREKAFSPFAILTLALGIGAVTAIYSVLNSVLLKPLAYADPGRLYAGRGLLGTGTRRIADRPDGRAAL